MDEHLNRLFEAAKAVDIDIGMDRNGVERALRDTQAANGMQTRKEPIMKIAKMIARTVQARFAALSMVVTSVSKCTG